MQQHQKYRDLRVILSMLRIMNRASGHKIQSTKDAVMIAPEPEAFLNDAIDLRQQNFEVRNHKRLEFDGKVIISSKQNKPTVTGSVENISSTGLFVSCDPQHFQKNELLNIEIIPSGSSDSYKTRAKIARISTDPAWPMGIGLKFMSFLEET
tara:strand:+ start:1564 stop:2019 length:456 start_codon:yes stop_codon:yes gene_type:complete